VTERRARREAAQEPGAPPDPAGPPPAGSESVRFDGPDAVLAFADSFAAEAAEPAEARPAAPTPWVMFGMGDELFAIPVEAVREAVRAFTITRVPHAPYPVAGVIQLRGRVIPVVDLRKRIGLPAVPVTRRTRILVADLDGRRLGLLVDGLHQVIRLDRAAIVNPPEDVMTEQSQYLVGVYRQADRLVFLLDVAAVLTIPKSLERV
jgi:purine-binding chemotaxis protein CheW